MKYIIFLLFKIKNVLIFVVVHQHNIFFILQQKQNITYHEIIHCQQTIFKFSFIKNPVKSNELSPENRTISSSVATLFLRSSFLSLLSLAIRHAISCIVHNAYSFNLHFILKFQENKNFAPEPKKLHLYLLGPYVFFYFPHFLQPFPNEKSHCL